MQIGNISFLDTFTGATFYTLKPDYARKGEARWFEDVLPEVARRTLDYSRRDPMKGTPFTMHKFRLGLPVLKSMVTDPAGPYAPVPALDFAPPAEFTIWTHDRDTEAARIARCAAFMTSVTGSSFNTLIEDVVIKGRSLT